MPEDKRRWTILEARALREPREHILKIARGPDLCEVDVHVGYSRMAGHEPYEAHVSVDRVKVLRGGARLDREVERWLSEHESDVVDATEDGPPDPPCALCNTETPAELLEDVTELAPLLGFVCEDCAERVACEEHEEDCSCGGCARERQRHERAQLAAEAHVHGGLSPLGLALVWPLDE
jgi:hypothetical protein